MPLSVERSLDAIATHSAGFADAARRGLAPIGPPRVEHCPDWDLADLVWHLTEVHWFWGTIAGELLSEPPPEERRPGRRPDDELVEAFSKGAADLVRTLGSADQSAACWTWFPAQQDVAFITRHQVQEAAVHHWDAAGTVGDTVVFDPDVAADCIEEFLTTSLADADDVPRIGATLDGALVLHATDTGQSWTVSQETPQAALTWVASDEPATVSGTASDLLLWVYGRVELPVSDPGVVARFRMLSSTT